VIRDLLHFGDLVRRKEYGCPLGDERNQDLQNVFDIAKSYRSYSCDFFGDAPTQAALLRYGNRNNRAEQGADA
jgi:hypothetical protein